MIKSLNLETINDWLNNTLNESDDKSYRHLLLKENSTARTQVIGILMQMVHEAHEDARLRLRKAFEISLDPIENDQKDIYDPTYGYPEVFDITTLKGYFGEIFAGIIAENFSPFNEQSWKVPAFSFRYHEIAFDQLEMLMMTGEMISAIPGRTGDDCLAFVMENEKIIKILFCEAKCTASHSSDLISDAHKKISSKNSIPVEIRRLIEILRDYDDDDALRWIDALRKLRVNMDKDCERYDLVSYICGSSPKIPKNRTTWMPLDAPHVKYTGKRNLEAVEIHLSDVEDLIKMVYGKEN
ncbi:hypothetical protein [Paenibacillus odorifer]|uniref:hypothetical protein n=1 Tax=Paenibacillus odorifer TaxID=189426 RepID=UPI00289EDE77|nr:hypothetical protein [Paenibacillus odorifer]